MNLWTLISHLISFVSLIFKPNTLIIHKPHFKVYMHLKRNLRTWKMFLRQSPKILVSNLTTSFNMIANFTTQPPYHSHLWKSLQESFWVPASFREYKLKTSQVPVDFQWTKFPVSKILLIFSGQQGRRQLAKSQIFILFIKYTNILFIKYFQIPRTCWFSVDSKEEDSWPGWVGGLVAELLELYRYFVTIIIITIITIIITTATWEFFPHNPVFFDNDP